MESCWQPEIEKVKIKKSVAEKYGLDGDYDEMLFTINNPTSSDVYFDLFQPFVVEQYNVPNTPNGYIQPPIVSGSPIPPTPLPPPITPVFWIGGSEDYNETVRDFVYSPAWVRRIYFYSKNQSNLNQVIQHLYKDANGNRRILPVFPSLSIGVNQFQNWIGQVNFDTANCILGVNQWFRQFFVEANSEIGLLLIYKQIDKSNMLSSAPCFCPNILRKWSEKDLALNDYTAGSPFKQNMYKGQKELAVRPFDFSILKEYTNS